MNRKHWDNRSWLDAHSHVIPIWNTLSRHEYTSALQLLSRVQLTPESRILHVACGARTLPPMLNAKVIHLDQSHAMITANRLQHPANHFIQSNAYNLPFDSSSIDVILAIGLTEYIHQPKAWLQACSRVLSPNGFLIFSFAKYSLLNFARRLWNPTLYLRTPEFWRSQLDEIKFRVIDSHHLLLQTQFIAQKSD